RARVVRRENAGLLEGARLPQHPRSAAGPRCGKEAVIARSEGHLARRAVEHAPFLVPIEGGDRPCEEVAGLEAAVDEDFMVPEGVSGGAGLAGIGAGVGRGPAAVEVMPR